MTASSVRQLRPLHNLTLSPEILAVATMVAAKRELAVDEYIESLVRDYAIPLLAESLGVILVAPVAEPEPIAEPKPAKLAKPRKKARKKTSLRWLCPSCGEKIRPQGNKVHFMACATKAGLTVREIAIFCHGDSALPRMYGCTMHSTANEIEAGIRKLAKAVHYERLLLEAAGGRSSSTRTRLTAKTRLRK